MGEQGLSVRQNMIWNSVGSMVYMGCQWLLTVLITRISGYGVAGDFSLALNLTNIFFCIATFGMKTFQVSDLTGRYRTGTYYSSRIVTCALGLLSCTVYVFCNSYTLEQKLIVVAYMLYKVTEAAFDVITGVFQKRDRMDQTGKSLIARGVLSLVVFTLLQIAFQNLTVSILGMTVACTAVIALWDYRYAKRLDNDRVNWSFGPLKGLLIECLPLVLYVVIDTSVASLPRVFLEGYHGNEALGYYASVATPAVIIQMASNYIFNPLITLFTKHYFQNEPKQFKSLFIKSMLAIVGIAAVGMLVAYFLGDWGLALIFGDSILPYSYLLLPAVICALLIGIVRLLSTILTIIRKLGLLLAVNIVTLLCSIGLSVLLIPSLDMQGVNVVIGTALTFETIILFVCILVVVTRHFKNEALKISGQSEGENG